MNIRYGDKIAVWFSCGAASAVAAKLTVERFGFLCDVRVINSPIKEEDADNRRFLYDVASWIGQPIEIATNPKFPDSSAVSVWSKERYMSGVAGAPCTKLLKKESRYIWETQHAPDFHVLGFTYDEQRRDKLFRITERQNIIPVLIDEKLTKRDCFNIVKAAGIKIPLSYRQGYPNANCKGCVKSSSPTYWNLVRRIDPDVFKQRAEQSREIGCRLVEVHKKRIFLDELSPSTKGGKLKGMDSECGIFCPTPL